MIALQQYLLAIPFGSPDLIFYDSVRAIAGLGTLLVIAVTPYALIRSRSWSQRVRFIGAAIVAVGLASAAISTLGIDPVSPWRTLVVAAGVVLMSIGYIAFVGNNELPEIPPTVIRTVDRLGNVPAALIVADDTGRIVTASGMTQDVIGWTVESLVGRPLATIIPQQYIEAHYAGLDRVVHGESSAVSRKTMNVHVLTRQKTEKACQLTVLDLHQEEGCPRRFLGVIMSSAE